MKDVLLVILMAIIALQAIHIWRLTKRRDEQDDAIDDTVKQLREAMEMDSEMKRMKKDQRKP